MAGKKKKDDGRLTPKEFAVWLPAKEALKAVADAVGGYTAPTTILERLAAGLLRGAAEDTDYTRDREALPMQRFLVIPAWAWKELFENGNHELLKLWRDGGQTIEKTEHHGPSATRHVLRIFGARFDPAGLRKIPGVVIPTDNLSKSDPTDVVVIARAPRTFESLRPKAAQRPVSASPAPVPARENTARSPVGRPSKDFWEDMVIAATRAILYDDTLKPKTQADVQRWMADWAIANGHGHPGETALKERARKVFLACRD